jgi:LuxR family maltose regulon positive regulatory protein
MDPTRHKAGAHLNSRDRELLQLLAAGRTTQEIAAALQVSAKTIQSLRRGLMAKVGAKRIPELVKYAQDHTGPASSASSAADKRSVPTLLQTKLHAPVHIRKHVARPRLLETLNENERCPLTLVSAPAGYGKSTLVAQWLNASKRRSAWVSLGNDDNDLRVFLRYWVAAVQTLFPRGCIETTALLEATELPPRSVLVGSLSNDLEAIGKPFFLVLDDYHCINNEEVHNLLGDLLRYPPRPLHLVLITRRDPPLSLAALRASGKLTQIRQEELRFTKPEMGAVLNKMAGVTVSDTALTHLNEAMEGWIVGLHLVGLLLRDEDDPDAFLLRLKGDFPEVRDYLVAEVLARLPASIQGCLIKVSILNRLCGPLCEALCSPAGRSADLPMNGAEFIRELDESNLFVIGMDGRGEWWRFHHVFQQLLASQLRQRCPAAEIDDLHRRASDWFESEGLVDEAIHHALAAKDERQAALAVERNWRAMMNAGKWHVAAGWLSKLPAQLVQERPELLLALAFKHFYYLNVPAIPPVLDKIETLAKEDAETPDLSGEVAMFRSYCDYLTDQGASSLRHIEYALERIPVSDVEFRSQTEILFSLSGLMEGQLDRVTRDIRAWLSGPSAVDGLRECCLLWSLAFTHYMAGDLPAATRRTRTLRKAAESSGIGNMVAWSNYLDGLVHLQRGDLRTAIQQLEKAGERKYLHLTRAAADALGALAVAYQANGQIDQASTTLQTLEHFSTDLGLPFSDLVDACAAQIALMSDRPESALDWLRRTRPPSEMGMMSWFIQPCVIRCKALVAQSSAESLAEAEAKLRELADMNRAHHNTCQLISILSLLAVVCGALRKRDEAFSTLDNALALARPGGFVFPFIELGQPMVDLLKRLRDGKGDGAHIDRILSVFPEEVAATAPRPSPSPRASSPLIEPLTNRELDTLELLAKRLYDKEIAEGLSVSTETVRTHLKHIYQKLQVSNRRQAIIKAEEFGLLRGE